jgi:hypothetical protein
MPGFWISAGHFFIKKGPVSSNAAGALTLTPRPGGEGYFMSFQFLFAIQYSLRQFLLFLPKTNQLY